MHSAKRSLLLETAPLLSVLSMYTDARKLARGRRGDEAYDAKPDALEHLLQPVTGEITPLFDRVVIPDHVFYEVTGILPISLPFMRKRFAEIQQERARAQAEKQSAQGHPEKMAIADMHLRQVDKKLADVIDMYALASPRGEVHDAEGQQKNHIRVLLYFVAKHPECILDTDVGKAFCSRLKANFSVLSSSSDAVLAQYHPTFSDAFDTLSASFEPEHLRVHAGQLMMMGIINEREFNERLGLDEKARSFKKRFYKTNDFLNKFLKDFLSPNDQMRLVNEDAPTQKKSEQKKHRRNQKPPVMKRQSGNGVAKTDYVPYALYASIKREEEAISHRRDSINPENYLTYGTFVRHSELLHMLLHRYDQSGDGKIPDTQDNAEELSRQAFGPSALLMEHYLYGGILANDNRTLLAASRVLGFSNEGVKLHDRPDAIRAYLYKQGFYEISPTVAQLQAIADALPARQPVLDQFLRALPAAEKSMQARFRNTCHNQFPGSLEAQSELRMHDKIGLAYEKVFADALVNGMLSWHEFLALVEHSAALPISHEVAGVKYHGSQSGDLLLLPAEDIAHARICMRRDGFTGRVGKTKPEDQNKYFSDASFLTAAMHEGTHRYMAFNAKDLLERCHSALSDPSASSRLYRAFETILYPAVERDSVAFRKLAIDLLGEDRLVQLEKDFVNRHARKSYKVQPPFRSLGAALHTNSRIMRKNLGEVATMQAAITLAESYPEADVFVAGHDSDLFPHPERRLQLEDAVVRQHADVPGIRAMNSAFKGNRHVHFVNTQQLLDTLNVAMGREALGRYESVKAKAVITSHRSKTWADTVHAHVAAAANYRD